MKLFVTSKKEHAPEEGTRMFSGLKSLGRLAPPHERKDLLRIEFDETDWGILSMVFGDEDTAMAAAEIIHNAPPEIQILAIQLINIIEEAA